MVHRISVSMNLTTGDKLLCKPWTVGKGDIIAASSNGTLKANIRLGSMRYTHKCIQRLMYSSCLLISASFHSSSLGSNGTLIQSMYIYVCFILSSRRQAAGARWGCFTVENEIFREPSINWLSVSSVTWARRWKETVSWYSRRYNNHSIPLEIFQQNLGAVLCTSPSIGQSITLQHGIAKKILGIVQK